MSFLRPTNVVNFLRPNNLMNFSVAQSQNFVKSNVMKNTCGLLALYATALAVINAAKFIYQKAQDEEGTDTTYNKLFASVGTAITFSLGTLNPVAGWVMVIIALSNKKMWTGDTYSFNLPGLKNIGYVLASQCDAIKSAFIPGRDTPNRDSSTRSSGF